MKRQIALFISIVLVLNCMTVFGASVESIEQNSVLLSELETMDDIEVTQIIVIEPELQEDENDIIDIVSYNDLPLVPDEDLNWDEPLTTAEETNHTSSIDENEFTDIMESSDGFIAIVPSIDEPVVAGVRGLVTSTSVALYGTVVSTGGQLITERGFWIREESEIETKQYLVSQFGEFRVTITNLEPETTYVARAIVRYAGLPSGAIQSPPITFTTLSIEDDFPTPPENFEAVATYDGMVVFTWEPPLYSGREEIIRYAISDGYRVRYVASDKTSEITPNLRLGVEYNFSICAEYASGPGPAAYATVTPKHVAIVVVPGIMGTRLEDGDEKRVWEPGFMDSHGLYAFSEYMKCNENGEPNLDEVTPRFDGVGTKEIYKDIMGRLIIAFEGQATVRFFAYDWRLSVHKSALELQRFLTPYSEVVLVAHSMGGLVTSAYLNISETNQDKIKHLITIATPFWGSPKMMHVMETGEIFGNVLYDPFLRGSILALANNYPAIYQLAVTAPLNDINNLHYLVKVSGNEYTYTETLNLLRSRPWALSADDSVKTIFEEGISLHESLLENNVHIVDRFGRITYIVGYGQSTIRSLIYGPDEEGHTEFKIQEPDPTNDGDGTVLVYSASNSLVERDNVSLESFPYDHIKLVQEKDVIDKIINIITSVLTPSSDLLSMVFERTASPNINARGWLITDVEPRYENIADGKCINATIEGFHNFAIIDLSTNQILEVIGTNIYRSTEEDGELLGIAWLLNIDTNRYYILLDNGEYRIELSNPLNPSIPSSMKATIQFIDHGYHRKIERFQSDESTQIHTLILGTHNTMNIDVLSTTNQAMMPTSIVSDAELREMNTDKPKDFMTTDTLSSVNGRFLVTVQNASVISMFGSNIGLSTTSNANLGLVQRFTPDIMQRPYQMFISPPEWGCGISTYGDGMIYILRNADYIFSFISANGNADILVQRIFVHDNIVVAEDYPFQLVQFGNNYLLTFKGE
ncbi:MAG: hypothetical protein FWG88_10300 [Oscillospiraceae bacterium]|nr:hypothetical protein [Oscillospiraceae bacterium]